MIGLSPASQTDKTGEYVTTGGQSDTEAESCSPLGVSCSHSQVGRDITKPPVASALPAPRPSLHRMFPTVTQQRATKTYSPSSAE